ncbi:hypothetical protein SDC49_02035 [Lactobacillus sp. R2/2]|nr:hypothetical protein [Lactobacillus sp. R2/2]
MSIAAVLVAGGCSKPKKQSEPILTKSQVIKCSQKSFKSGQAKQTVTLGTDTSKQVVATTALFGGNPTVFQLNYETQSKGKTSPHKNGWTVQITFILTGRVSGTKPILTN